MEVHVFQNILKELSECQESIVQATKGILAKINSLNVPTTVLHRHIYEFLFDTLTFDYQDSLLFLLGTNDYTFSDASPAVQTKLLQMKEDFEKAVAHRFVKRVNGKTYPKRAQHLADKTFPNGADGRILCFFPRNPASENCSILANVIVNRKGSSQDDTFMKIQLHHELYQRWVEYFSPTPVITHNQEFGPSTHPKLQASSQLPIAHNRPCFGFGQVKNYRDKHSNVYTRRFVDTASSTKNNEGMLLDDTSVRSHMGKLDTQINYAEWEESWIQALKKSPPLNTEFIVINQVECARVLFLQIHQAYIRYFFPGVISQHPATKEFYAGWRTG
jgi:hypothetical protein